MAALDLVLCNHRAVKRVVTGAAILVALVSGCGNASGPGRPDTGSATGKPSGAPATSVTASGVYKVGQDIAPGVYTTTDLGCTGYTASNADFDLEDEEEPDAYLAGAIQIGDVQRILVYEGEFFTSLQCDRWQRETVGKPKSPDPATLAGGCEVLVGGDDLVHQVVSFLRKPRSAQDSAVASELQERLTAPVDADNNLLGDPAGQLVDALDYPPAYLTARGDHVGDVARAVAKIRSACSRR
jgi:hypothetical protein